MISKIRKIAFISHSGDLGGSELSLLELVRGLVKMNIDCHVVLPQKGELYDELANIGIQVSVVPVPWWAFYDKASIDIDEIKENIIDSILPIISVLRPFDPDIVCTNTSVINQGVFVSKILDKPHVWFVREFGSQDHGFQFELDSNTRIQFMIENSDYIICNSNAIKDFLTDKHDSNKVSVIYNPVSLGPSISPKCEFKRKTDTFKLLFVGSIHEGKGVKDAICAVESLIKKGVEVELDVLGRGNWEYINEILKYIENAGIKDRIRFYGFVRSPEKFFESTDVLLMCSSMEAFGRVTVEALKFGKPVIGVASGGTVELIQNEQNGLLYKCGDVRGLSGCIERLYKDRKLYTRLSKNANRINKEKFSVKSHTAEVIKIFKKVVSSYQGDEKESWSTEAILDKVSKMGLNDNNKIMKTLDGYKLPGLVNYDIYREYIEFQGFKTGIIWKTLSVWRKIKNSIVKLGKSDSYK